MTATPDSSTTTKPIALLVLGMHRSGTSVLTRVLSLMGADLPGNLLPANEGNESGYWESEELSHLQDEILQSLNLAWDRAGTMPADWHAKPASEEYRRRVVEILRRDFGDSQMFVLKDPRISLLVPFWIDCLTDFGTDPVFVISVRHPLEVAGSLSRRNEFLPQKSVLLWLRYMLDAQRATTGLRRCHVAYEDLLADWRSTVDRIARETSITFPRSIERAAGEIDALISNNLRHHKSAPDALATDPRVNPWVRDAYAVALAAARGDQSQLPATNDRIFTELETANQLFDPLMAEHQTATWKAWHLERQVAEKIKEATAATERFHNLADQLHTANHNLHLANTDLHAKNSELYEKNNELQSVTAKLQTADAQQQAAAEQLRWTEQQRQTIGQQLQSTSAELHTTTAQLQSTKQQLQIASDQLATATVQLQELQSGMARYRDEFAERETERRRLMEDLAAQKTQIVALTEKLKERKRSAEQSAAPDVNTSSAFEALPNTQPASLPAPVVIPPPSLSARLQSQLALLMEVANRYRTPRALHQLWLFNADYYLETNPDVALSGVDPRAHFLRHGWREARSPHPIFDPSFYLENNPDVAAAGANPVVHFLTFAVKENRSPNRLFDLEFYLRQNPDVTAAGMDPIRHYIEHGGPEGRNPGPLFEGKAYADLNPEYRALGVDPLSHYLWRGIHEGLLPLPMSLLTVPMLSERSLFAQGAGLDMLEDPEDSPFEELPMPKETHDRI
jgi:hypothetical protein